VEAFFREIIEFHRPWPDICAAKPLLWQDQKKKNKQFLVPLQILKIKQINRKVSKVCLQKLQSESKITRVPQLWQKKKTVALN